MANDITFCEMREKEVINIIDGKKLGRLLDIVFTLHGNVIGIVVPGEKHFFKNIASNESIFIPWKCIKKIGADTVLVELTTAIAPTPSTPSEGCCNNNSGNHNSNHHDNRDNRESHENNGNNGCGNNCNGGFVGNNYSDCK